MNKRPANIYCMSDIKQKITGNLRRVTGLWARKAISRKPTDQFPYLKSGRINIEGWDNLNAFGPKTILMVLKNKKKKGRNPPDYYLVATEDWGSPIEKKFWEDLKKKHNS
jgi:hypothetical protein